MDTSESSRRLKLFALHTLYSSRSYVPSKKSALVLVYNCKGSVSVTVAEREYVLTPGRFLLSHLSDEHRIAIGDSRSQGFLLEVVEDPEGLNLKALMEAAGYSSYALRFQGTDVFVRFDIEENRLLFTLGELANELDNRERANRKIVEALFEVLLIKLERSVQFHGRAPGFSYVAQAKQYIVENLSNNITVQSIADHIGIHRSYLMRIFHQQTHQSVKMYINRMRISQATVLLSDSNLSITEIAFRVGFNSRQNFYVVFEKLIGCSPSEYRISRGVNEPGAK